MAAQCAGPLELAENNLVQPAPTFRFHVMGRFTLVPQALGRGIIGLDRYHIGVRSGNHFHIGFLRHSDQSAGGSFLPDVASCCYQKPHQLIISRLYQAPAFKLDGESNGLAMLGEQDTGGFVAGDVARERFVARILRQNNRERSVGRGAGH